MIVVLREESAGVEGLQKMKDATKTKFKLALDLNKKQTPRYSPSKRSFNSYVVDKEGKISAIITGDLRNRAKSDQLLAELKKLESK